MRTPFQWLLVRALALLLAVTAVAAPAQDRVPFRQEELDQMLAPVALYPDSLLSQVLMASTYPLEVVQAARWSRANPGLKGRGAVDAVEPMDWDASVKSLTAFPQVLAMMDEKLDWTERLGEAFLAQQADVMDTVQDLRRRAEAAGNLRSGERMRVARQDGAILIEPPAPEVVYVPYYDPFVVYGPWWWPAYPPVYWAPPPAYYVVPAHRPAFLWGSGIVITAGFFFGHFDWPHRHVKVVHVHHYSHEPRPVRVHATWRHDPAHRRGVPFRHAGIRPAFDAQQAPVGRDATRSRVDSPAQRPSERSTEIRQRRWEERRAAGPERREPATHPVVTQEPRNRPRAVANNDRPRPAPRAETRLAPPDRGTEPRRIAPQAENRRWERGEPPRPQAREIAPRATVAAPAVRHEPRPAANAPAPRPATEARQRAESRFNDRSAREAPPQRAVMRDQTPAARQSADVPARAPRSERPHQGSDRGVRAHGNGAAPALR